MLLEKGRTALIDGPASVRITTGKASIFACPLKIRRNYILRPWRRYPLYAEEDTEYEISLGENASHVVVDGNPIEHEWISTVEKCMDDETIVLIGGVDSGKTTLATVLGNMLVQNRNPCIIADLDPGQSYLSPPTTLGSTKVNTPYHDLSFAPPLYILHIGSTSPTLLAEYQIRMSENLLNKIRRKEKFKNLIIDCDGWIEGENAIKHKMKLLDIVKPTHVIFMNNIPNGLDEYIKDISIKYSVVNSSKFVLKRGQEARKALRELSYRRFLKNAIIRTIPITWVELTTIPTEAFGTKQNPIEYFRRTLTAYAEENNLLGVDAEDVMEGFLKNRIGVLSYLIGVNGDMLGIGLLAEINLRKNTLKIFTPVREQLKKIIISGIILSIFGEEIFHVKLEK